MTRQKPALIRANVVDEKGKVYQQTVRLDQLKPFETKFHETLTPEVIKAAKELWQKVSWAKLAKSEWHWVEGFKYEQDPEKEIRTWQKIVRVYHRMWNLDDSKPYKNGQVLSAIIGVTMAMVDVSEKFGVDDDFVDLIHILLQEE